MGYKTAAHILNSAEDLKAKVARKCDLLNDTQTWTDQQRLQTIYHQVLVLDLEYALDKKVEQDLWNVGFKTHISTLQELIRDKKNPKRSDYQALLTWSLEAATGFYISLLQELCNAFGISFSFRRPGNAYGQIKEALCQDGLSSGNNLPQKSSCLYICQYCLVHLGDVARYRNQRKQAESFYKQAIEVSPTSGHPYNQLALLQASQGDKLSTVYYYIRGILVKNPFPASISNLTSTFNSILDKESYLMKVQTKITVNEFVRLFLCTHEHLQSLTNLKQAEMGVKNLNSTMTALVATHSFTTSKLVQITIVNIYTLKQISGETLTQDECFAHRLVMELLSGLLSAFLVPVHTLKTDETVLDYYALPAVKLLIYWIENEPEVLTGAAFTNKLQIWPSLCKLLNNGANYIKDFDHTKYEKTPLSEDRELQGFVPFQENLKQLDFESDEISSGVEKLIRMKQIIDFGVWLSGLKESPLIMNKENVFEPSCTQPDPTDDLLEEMKSFNVSHHNSETNRDSDKKGGILKPQGSLEKSREERETNAAAAAITPTVSCVIETKSDKDKMKRVKHNAALQSIFKKMEESKQVKFNVEEPRSNNNNNSAEKPENIWANAPNNNNGQFSLQFNPSKPPPPPLNKNDYLNSLRSIGNANVAKEKETVFGGHPQMVPPHFQGGYQNRGVNMLPPPPLYAPQFGSNVWKPEEPPKPPPPQNWWQNSYSNFHQAPFMPQQPPPQQPFHPAIFNSNSNTNNSPWNVVHQPPMGGVGGYLGGGEENRGISMRQAMLKEANMQHGGDKTNSSGYSLFNANSWSPNLVGQLRAVSKGNESQQQMFPQGAVPQGPQSLAQLLEQQNRLRKNDS